MSPDRGKWVGVGHRNSYDPDVDGVHDLGGLDGFGPVEHTDSEPMFAEDWERRTFRMLIGSIGSFGGPGRQVPPFDRADGSRALPVVARTTSTG